MSNFDQQEINQRLQRVETLVRTLETAADSPVRSSALELMQSLMELHGAGIERMLEIVYDSGTGGGELIDALAADALVAQLLLLYDLHPAPFETRVQQALAEVRPYLHSHGGNVELVSLDQGAVKLRLQGSCNGCASSAATIQQTIEQALYQAAPDLQTLEIEGAVTTVAKQPAAAGLVQLERRASA
jgi:Fe-S cluster biogenesis protein NfuA